MSLRQRFADLVREVAAEDERLVVLVSDISHGILQPFAGDFPDRYYNIGICEPSIVNMASGLSALGFRPVVHTIAPFLVERSFEQLKLDFGYQKRSINLVSVGSAFDYSQLGCSHHSYSDAALVGQIPGSRVFLPGSDSELSKLFWAAYERPGINYFRLTENPHGQELANWTGDVGDGVTLFNGSDITLATVGARLADTIAAAEMLREDGVSPEVLYFPTLKPFDSELIRQSVERTHRVVTIEELSSRDGLYARVLESVTGLPNVQAKSLAITDFIHDYGSYQDLCRLAELDADSIVAAARGLLGD